MLVVARKRKGDKEKCMSRKHKKDEPHQVLCGLNVVNTSSFTDDNRKASSLAWCTNKKFLFVVNHFNRSVYSLVVKLNTKDACKFNRKCIFLTMREQTTAS